MYNLINTTCKTHVHGIRSSYSELCGDQTSSLIPGNRGLKVKWWILPSFPRVVLQGVCSEEVMLSACLMLNNAGF